MGEAQSLIAVFEGCYFLANYPMVWGWIGAVSIISIILLFVIAFVTFLVENS